MMATNTELEECRCGGVEALCVCGFDWWRVEECNKGNAGEEPKCLLYTTTVDNY